MSRFEYDDAPDTVECADCGHVVLKDDAVRTGTGKWLCHDCCPDSCAWCGYAAQADEKVTLDGEVFCCEEHMHRSWRATECDKLRKALTELVLACETEFTPWARANFPELIRAQGVLDEVRKAILRDEKGVR